MKFQVHLLRTVLWCTLFFAAHAAPLFAQNLRTAEEGFTIRKADQSIRLDGQLDEAFWANAEVLGNFNVNFPVDTGLATARTEVRFAFDQKNLYVAAVCYQDRSTYTIQSLRRDFGPGTSDVLNILIDPFKDGQNGFMFGVNPYNVQREALISNGNNLAFEWDNVWRSAVHNDNDKWTVEMAIPFKTLRYKVTEGSNSWHFNMVRTHLNPWEVSVWKRVPQQYPPNNLAFYGVGTWEDAPPKSRLAVTSIPYATGRYDLAYNRDENLNVTDKPDQFGGGLGGDVKVGVTPSLNLDLTINPDFSQVEVDRQVANLSRFQLFFPERRQFFLENRDLFGMFGFPDTRPFFSRQIGLADTSIDQSQRYAPVTILYGARLSGKINDNWRIGLLSMRTAKKEISSINTLPSSHFTVATVQRKLFARSTISAIVADKTNVRSGLPENQRDRFEAWNRVAGVEFNFYSKDNRWETESYFHRSFSPDPDKRGSAMAQFVGYDVRRYALRAGLQRVDTNYTADIGFVPRPGVQGIFTGAEYRWYPSGKHLNTFNIAWNGDLTTDLHFGLTDGDYGLDFNFGFKDQSFAGVGLYSRFTRLFEEFDPSNTDQTPLSAGDYTYNSVSFNYFSSSSYDLQLEANMDVGQFFNGQSLSLAGTLRYRVQPYGIVSMTYTYFRYQLPSPYADGSIYLLGPSVELALTRSLFASAFFQYNTQANNFNINTRLQWRFAPVSDIFLVYTDNSYAQSIATTPVRFLAPKNKSLVLKVVYWLNH
jgi:hypothetical protein